MPRQLVTKNPHQDPTLSIGDASVAACDSGTESGANETFTVQLSGPSKATITDSTGSGTILNDK